jgi:hypothetical protein
MSHGASFPDVIGKRLLAAVPLRLAEHLDVVGFDEPLERAGAFLQILREAAPAGLMTVSTRAAPWVMPSSP